jgi:hypothetical protein
LKRWFAVAIALSVHVGFGQGTNPEISADDVRHHVRYLASDELEGRKAGTEANRTAARYIAGEFKRFGLLPAGDNNTYFQEFEFVSAVTMGKGNRMVFSGPAAGADSLRLVPDVDFRPFGFSANKTVSGSLVFAGYGLSLPDSGYDDYATLDVRDRVVVVLRHAPDGNNPHGPYFSHASFRNKARVAREHGASALVVVTGPRDSEDDDLVKLSYDKGAGDSGIPVISMKRAPLAPLLEKAGRSLGEIQDSIGATMRPIGFEFTGVTVTASTELLHEKATTANIVGYLPGAQVKDQEEVLVIGAHMDHLGYGGPGSGSLDPDTHAIHNGADDNASGTAGLLELAESFSQNRADLHRGILFIAFSAEEIGTLGSAHYVNNPFVPLSGTVAMLNMDMIGRLEDRVLTIYGTGTSPAWDDLLAKHRVDSAFALKKVEDGYGPSDHTQFYAKDIPVLFFFSGTHDDYHKPSDDWETLNYEGEEEILKLVRTLASDILAEQERPVLARLQSTSPAQGGGGAAGFSVTLGVIPDYAFEGEGMKIGGVRTDGAAEKGGIRSGDVIIGLKGKKILNIYDYMAVLGELKAGQKVDVSVLRGSETLRLTVEPQKRK